MPFPAEMVSMLACPESKGPLVLFPASGSEPAFLLCPTSRLRYRIEQDLPVLLIEEAERLEPAAVDALIARARALGLAGA